MHIVGNTENLFLGSGQYGVLCGNIAKESPETIMDMFSAWSPVYSLSTNLQKTGSGLQMGMYTNGTRDQRTFEIPRDLSFIMEICTVCT